MTFSDTTAGIGASFRTDAQTADGRTDRRGSRNSYLDFFFSTLFLVQFLENDNSNPDQNVTGMTQAHKICHQKSLTFLAPQKLLLAGWAG